MEDGSEMLFSVSSDDRHLGGTESTAAGLPGMAFIPSRRSEEGRLRIL